MAGHCNLDCALHISDKVDAFQANKNPSRISLLSLYLCFLAFLPLTIALQTSNLGMSFILALCTHG